MITGVVRGMAPYIGLHGRCQSRTLPKHLSSLRGDPSFYFQVSPHGSFEGFLT